MSLKVLVCGGRAFSDWELLSRAMASVNAEPPGIGLVIEGGATGADRMASQWAATRGIHYCRVNALWDFHGRAAGPERNKAMLILAPDVVVALPGGSGTADMVKRAQLRGIAVRDFRRVPA